MRIMEDGTTLFRESIFHLREDLYDEKNFPFSGSQRGNTKSCISTSFCLREKWEIAGLFTIHQSEPISISDNYLGIISFIDNPKWITHRPPPHRFGILMASLLAFITLKPVKNSVKENYDLIEINDNKKLELALTYPIEKKIEVYKNQINEEEETSYKKELEELIKILVTLQEEDYIFVVEVIRVIQLSINLKKEDFGLAYSLLIQAIEAVALKNFPEEKKPGEKYPNHQRFKDFIIEFCPIANWDTFLQMDEFSQKMDFSVRGKIPSELSLEEYELSIRLTYKLRCNFVHESQNPPHDLVTDSMNPYFEPRKYPFTFSKGSRKNQIQITKDTYLITYGLMLKIAKFSIIKWFKTLQNN